MAGLLFYLNLFALPLIVGYVVLSGELAEVLVYPQLYQPEFVVVFCLRSAPLQCDCGGDSLRESVSSTLRSALP